MCVYVSINDVNLTVCSVNIPAQSPKDCRDSGCLSWEQIIKTCRQGSEGQSKVCYLVFIFREGELHEWMWYLKVHWLCDSDSNSWMSHESVLKNAENDSYIKWLYTGKVISSAKKISQKII